MSLEEALAKIKSPNLQSQQHTSVVLVSIEDTLRDQDTNFTPTAYFAALLSLLRQTGAAPRSAKATEVLTSTVYLLDLVSSHVPVPLLRAQCSHTLSLLAPIFSDGDAAAPLLRSALGCLESVLVAQDAAAWGLPQTGTSPIKAIPAILALALDERPKIRKRSLDALQKILRQPPQGPALDHPAADLCAITVLASLEGVLNTPTNAKGQKTPGNDIHDPHLIHLLRLIRAIAAASGSWPSKKIGPLVEALMAISKSSNDYQVMSAFETFEVIFDGMQDEVSSSKLPSLLDAIVELRPSQNDSQLLPPWIAVLSRGYQLASEVSPDDTFAKLPDLVEMIVGYLPQSSHNIRVSASECLISFFANCIPRRAILRPSVPDSKIFEQLGKIAKDLVSAKYQMAWMEVCKTLSALIQAMRWQGGQYLAPVVQVVGELRGNDFFQGRKEADELIGHGIRYMGPQAVLSVLPINLIQDSDKQQGRAWMLPLLRENISNTELAHFKSLLMPLSENFYQRIVDHGDQPKTPRIKIFETLVHQMWATLPGYCDLPLDLQTTVDQPFAELLSNLLYRQPELRVDLCRSLQNLVESNQAILASDLSEGDFLYERRTTRSQAEENLRHLASLASNLLAVLFNVYSQIKTQDRAFVLECINAYLGITSEHEVGETFNRVSAVLRESFPGDSEPAPPKQEQHKDKLPSTSHTLFDLVVALSTFLPRHSLPPLFSLASQILTHPSVTARDPQLIKKVYKLIPRLATSPIGASALESRNSELQTLLLRTSDKTPVPARRDRLLTLHTLIKYLPRTDLHFIPSVLSEVVLACKDTNQRAREAGFNLLIHCANRIIDVEMNWPETVIRNRLVAHMPDDAADAPATLEEMFTMVSAGLAGVAPHMVAATVAALARLMYEFHNRLAKEVCEDVVGTVEMFLQSRDREIVRAVLGFVKVAVVVLPDQLLNEKRMATVLRGCMVWSNENKGRMRMKVKGILERCIRRFGPERVEGWMGDNDSGRKLVSNIRKRKERTKRKKGLGNEDIGDLSDEQGSVRGKQGGQRSFNNEFDEAVYGTDEDDDSGDDSELIIGSDDDRNDNNMGHVGGSLKSGQQRSKKKSHKDRFILADDVNADDKDPLDLLGSSALASISSSGKARGYSKSKLDQLMLKRRAESKVNKEGKLVFNDDGAVESKARRRTSGAEDMLMGDVEVGGAETAVNAYMDAVGGPDAVRKGQRGRLKISNNKQQRNKGNAARSLTDAASGAGVAGDDMDLDNLEASEMSRSLTSGPKRPVNRNRGSSGAAGSGRKGLGVEKSRLKDLKVRSGEGARTSNRVQKHRPSSASPATSLRGASRRSAVGRGRGGVVRHGATRGSRGSVSGGRRRSL